MRDEPLRYRLAAVALTALGLTAMIADLMGFRSLFGLAIATGASPAPKVFSTVDGLETFSTRFEMTWTDASGEARSLVLTPEVYANVRGPYNRRNVYGAALAYAPVLAANPATAPMLEAVMHHAFCDEAPLLAEMGIEGRSISGAMTVRLLPERSEGLAAGLPLVFSVACR